MDARDIVDLKRRTEEELDKRSWAKALANLNTVSAQSICVYVFVLPSIAASLHLRPSNISIALFYGLFLYGEGRELGLLVYESPVLCESRQPRGDANTLCLFCSSFVPPTFLRRS